MKRDEAFADFITGQFPYDVIIHAVRIFFAHLKFKKTVQRFQLKISFSFEENGETNGCGYADGLFTLIISTKFPKANVNRK